MTTIFHNIHYLSFFQTHIFVEIVSVNRCKGVYLFGLPKQCQSQSVDSKSFDQN
jgi:hypothetical protein